MVQCMWSVFKNIAFDNDVLSMYANAFHLQDYLHGALCYKCSSKLKTSFRHSDWLGSVFAY